MVAKKLCPRCQRSLIDYPAISRRDNKTEICSQCGTDEAFFDLEIRSGRVFPEQIAREQAWLKKGD